MILKSKIIQFLSHSSLHQRSNALLFNGLLHFSRNSFCKVSGELESPQVQGWFKFLENPDHCKAILDSEEDVIPAIADWVENHNLGDRSSTGVTVSHKLSETTTDTDIDKISIILKNRFSSPNLVAQALYGCSVLLSEGLVERVLKRYNNDWIPAFGVFKWAQSQEGYVQSINVYNSMIDILGKAKQFELVWELVEEMHGAGHCASLITLTNVVKRYAKAKGKKDVLDAFSRLEQYGISRDISAMNIVLEQLTKMKNVEFAHDVYLELKSQIPPNIRTFNILIHGWCKSKKIEAAWKTLEEMETHGFGPDVISYTNIMEAHCREGDFSKAEALLHTMQEKGISPTVITYTVMMNALWKANKINKALEVPQKMKLNGCTPTTSFYGCLFALLDCAGRLKDAQGILKDMKKQGISPDVLIYNAMINIACKHSREETALKLLREMEEISCKPDVRTYVPLLKMCCKKKRMKVLFFLLGHMLKNDVSVDVVIYNLLVHGLCNSGKLEHACMFFEECLSKGLVPRTQTYNFLLSHLERKNMTGAKKLIEGLMLKARKQGESEFQVERVLLN